MTKGKILVVDDEENIRGSLKEILVDEGYEVSIAEDGETALRMIQSEAPDLVLLDVWIPGIDGIQTLKLLKKMDSNTEVVMMSGHGAVDTAVKATKLGAYDFIEKPFSLDTVLRKASEALQNKRGRAQGGGAVGEEVFTENWFIGSSENAAQVNAFLRKASNSVEPALICGESGLGKRFAARLIHERSKRRNEPFTEISCDTTSVQDFDALLFGKHSENSDDNHMSDSRRTTLAGSGTIFFDKLDSLSIKSQRKLFKALDRGIRDPKSSGGSLNARIIASSDSIIRSDSVENNIIKGFVGLFSGMTINITPLRQRREDIKDLVSKFVGDFGVVYGKHIETIDKKFLDVISSSPLPGNTVELYNIVEMAILSCQGATLTLDHLAPTDHEKQTGYAKSSKNTAIAEVSGTADKTARTRKAARRTSKNTVYQRTLRNSVVLCGQGLHSGIKTGIILSPLPPNSGIVFWDISSGGKVSGLLDFVRSTEYATTLSHGDVTIKTVEHLMSALHSYHIANLLVKIGDEAPIMDGSSLDFCKIIEDGGIKEQDAVVERIALDKVISVGDPDDGPYLAVEPTDNFSISYFLDYPPPIGKQEHVYTHKSGEHYRRTIAPARTFGFLKDIKKLEEAGLASGGKLSNVILIDNEKVVNTPLRFPNEPARHKILDLIGDLYLLGRPINGHFIAKRSGHTQNIALIKKISKHINSGKHEPES